MNMFRETFETTKRNHQSAESWLGGNKRLGRLNCGAGQLGFWASLQPWLSFLKRFAEFREKKRKRRK